MTAKRVEMRWVYDLTSRRYSAFQRGQNDPGIACSKTRSWISDALRQSRSYRWARARISADCRANLSGRRGERRDAEAARPKTRHQPLRDCAAELLRLRQF